LIEEGKRGSERKKERKREKEANRGRDKDTHKHEKMVEEERSSSAAARVSVGDGSKKRKVAVVSLQSEDELGNESFYDANLCETLRRHYLDRCRNSQVTSSQELPFEISFFTSAGNQEGSEASSEANFRCIRRLCWENETMNTSTNRREEETTHAGPFEEFDTILYLCEYEATASNLSCSWTQMTQFNLLNTFRFLQGFLVSFLCSPLFDSSMNLLPTDNTAKNVNVLVVVCQR